MYKVSLDYKELEAAFGEKLEPMIDEALKRLGEMAKANINQLSSEKLRTETHKEFIKALKMSRKKYSVTIEITDPRMASLEEGYSSFDMKPALIKGKASKTVPGGGRYMNVPMHHRTMKNYGKGTYITPDTMREAVKKAQESLSKGETMTMFASEPDEPLTIHSDMRLTREEAKTFRRVSDRSPAEDWIHPGYDGIKAFEKTVEEIEKVAERVISEIAEGIE